MLVKWRQYYFWGVTVPTLFLPGFSCSAAISSYSHALLNSSLAKSSLFKWLFLVVHLYGQNLHWHNVGNLCTLIAQFLPFGSYQSIVIGFYTPSLSACLLCTHLHPILSMWLSRPKIRKCFWEFPMLNIFSFQSLAHNCQLVSDTWSINEKMLLALFCIQNTNKYYILLATGKTQSQRIIDVVKVWTF